MVYIIIIIILVILGLKGDSKPKKSKSLYKTNKRVSFEQPKSNVHEEKVSNVEKPEIPSPTEPIVEKPKNLFSVETAVEKPEKEISNVEKPIVEKPEKEISNKEIIVEKPKNSSSTESIVISKPIHSSKIETEVKDICVKSENICSPKIETNVLSSEEESFKKHKIIGDELELEQRLVISSNFSYIDAFYDMYIPYNNSYIQVDAILVTHRGLIVIECKNYMGHIYGSVHKDYWAQYRGRKSYKIINPVVQNNNHIKAIKKFLNLEIPCYNIINYGNADFRKVYLGDSNAILINRTEIVDMILNILNKSPYIVNNYDYITNILRNIEHYRDDPKIQKQHKDYVNRCKNYYEKRNI